jgi:phasin family protein
MEVREQLVAINQANLDAAARFAAAALDGAQRFFDLQLKTARAVLNDTAAGAKALAAAKDLQEIAALREELAAPALEKATAYARSLYDVTAATQAEVGKIVEERVADLNRRIVAVLERLEKEAPAGSEVGIAATKSAVVAFNAAYENFVKVAREIAEIGQAHLEALAKQASNGAKKAKKS